MTIKYPGLTTKLNVVGVIADSTDLNYAYTVPVPPHQGAFSIDMLELRADKIAIGVPSDRPFQRLLAVKKPLIFTPRDMSEGGGRIDWSIKDRRKLYLEFMPHVAAVDVEAGKLGELKEVIAEAKRLGVAVIVSYHNFVGTPIYDELIILAERCRVAGGDILKLAVNIRSLYELSEFAAAISAIRETFPFKVSSMGTEAPFGQYYRMIDAHAGSPLIYGYLIKQASSGQIKASRIRQLLKELK